MNVKKRFSLLLLAALLLTGCEKEEEQQAASAELFEITNGVTFDGVQVGDGKAEFIDAYSDYTIQAAYTDTDSSYMVMSINEIPYDKNISTLIANFFIDEEPVTEDELCEENDIEYTELYDLLSSTDYLRAHEVIYRYLRFLWEDSVITDIDSGEFNYNETYEVPKQET
ncbi:MAG: hypothetical protein LUH53_10955 [Lachnospiraceae bacterium]|nr:hypothetical protein [Lachnospiraceae bacterium]